MPPIRFSLLFTVLLAVMPLTARAQSPSAAGPVGTFDRTSVIVAYYHSPQWAAILADRMYERNAAQTAGDTAKVKDLDQWGQDRQSLALRQLAGKAGIENILAVMQPELRSLSSELKLTAVLEAPAPGSTAVDVTPQLLDWLHASGETRKVAAAAAAKAPSAPPAQDGAARK
jgi:hypothetical protein